MKDKLIYDVVGDNTNNGLNLASGIYTYKQVANGVQLKTGKIIKE